MPTHNSKLTTRTTVISALAVCLLLATVVFADTNGGQRIYLPIAQRPKATPNLIPTPTPEIMPVTLLYDCIYRRIVTGDCAPIVKLSQGIETIYAIGVPNVEAFDYGNISGVHYKYLTLPLPESLSCRIGYANYPATKKQYFVTCIRLEGIPPPGYLTITNKAYLPVDAKFVRLVEFLGGTVNTTTGNVWWK